MSLITRGMGVPDTGNGGTIGTPEIGDGLSGINIVESIKGKIISEVDVKTIIAIQSEKDTIKGKVNK